MESTTHLYTSTVPYVTDRVRAAAVYCSDGRFGEHFDDFLTHGLKLPYYDRVALPGGPACLVRHGNSDAFQAGVLDELKFLVEGHGLDRVVLIQHGDCAYYAQRLELGDDNIAARQRADVAHAVELIRRTTNLQAIDAYLATPKDGHVIFDRIVID